MKYQNSETYNPNALVDWAKEKLSLKNDAALAVAMETRPSVISKVRHRVLPIGDMFLLRLHEITGVRTKEMKAIMGV